MKLNPRLRARFEKMHEEETRLSRRQKEEIVALLPSSQVKFDEPLSFHSSMGVGGPAECFIVPSNIEELKKLLGWATEQNIEYRFLGGGSNVLVRDGGVKGLIIKLGTGFDFVEEVQSSNQDVLVKVGAAYGTARFLAWSRDRGYAGFERLAGVWGTLGGNLLTNAGTNLGTISDLIEEVTIVTREMKELTIKKSALKFEYRSLKLPRTAAVVSAVLKLAKSTPDEVALAIEKQMTKRGETQPIDQKSLGCVFKNPGKTAAGFLIEDAGLKGVRVGGARVSSVHANFIVNEGSATAKDVVVLINLVRERVREQTGLSLETEVEIIGK